MKYFKFFIVLFLSIFLINVYADSISVSYNSEFYRVLDRYKSNDSFFNSNCYLLDDDPLLSEMIINIYSNNFYFLKDFPLNSSGLVHVNFCSFNSSLNSYLCSLSGDLDWPPYPVLSVRDNIYFPEVSNFLNTYVLDDYSYNNLLSYYPYLDKTIYEPGVSIKSMCYYRFGSNHRINIDDISPTISLVGNNVLNIEINTIFNDPGYSCSDNVDKSCDVIVSGSVDTSKVGTYILEYNATDLAGNKSLTLKRTVNIIDTTSPVLSLIGDSILYYGLNQEYEELGYNVFDNSNEDIIVDIDLSNLDVSSVGTYDIIYSACDSSKNCTNLIRKIKVQSIESLDFTGSQYLFFNFSDIQDLFPNFNFSGMSNVEQFGITILFNIFITVFLLLIIYIILKSVYKMLSIVW